MLIRGFKHLQW